MKKFRATSIAVMILSLGVLGGALFFSYRTSTTDGEGELALGSLPDIAFRGFAGEDIRLAGFRGTPVLINAWASWCPFCKEELRDFASVKKEFGEKIIILAVNRGEPEDAAARYLEQFGTETGIVFAHDPEDSFYKSVGGFSMPETVFVDAEGKIRDHRRGVMRIDEMRRRIESAFSI